MPTCIATTTKQQSIDDITLRIRYNLHGIEWTYLQNIFLKMLQWIVEQWNGMVLKYACELNSDFVIHNWMAGFVRWCVDEMIASIDCMCKCPKSNYPISEVRYYALKIHGCWMIFPSSMNRVREKEMSFVKRQSTMNDNSNRNVAILSSKSCRKFQSVGWNFFGTFSVANHCWHRHIITKSYTSSAATENLMYFVFSYSNWCVEMM